MARPSARPRLIDAALRVVEQSGITALTLDAVADEAGVTKRGLIYHFPGKHALLVGIHEALAERSEQDLLEATGEDPRDANLVARTRGYVRAMLKSPLRASTQLFLDAANDPDLLAPWERVFERWFSEQEQTLTGLDDLSRRCLVARMAADGAWISDRAQTPEAREALIEAILAPLADVEESAAPGEDSGR